MVYCNKEILPYDDIDYPTKEYEYDFDGVAPEKIKIMQREEAGVNKTLDSWQFYDGFNKLIQTKTEFNSTDQVTQDVYYDGLYRVEEQTINYLSNFSENYSSPDSAVGKVRFYYDALDRVVNVTNPDGTNKSTVFTTWNATFYDENEHRKDTFFDAYGRIVNVVEFEGGGAFNTTYEYDALGNLLRITDAVGNTLNYTYDSLNRKTALEDPDLGKLNYSYDLIGNLIQQTDNNGTLILMGYDSLNRITSKNGSIGDTVTNIYDVDVNGTLYNVDYPESSAIYSYDQRLRKISEEGIMWGVSFVTNYSYDSLDRLTFTLFSDGGNESLSYNERGLVNRSEDNLDNIDYNAQNKPVVRTYANNLDSTFEYDSLSLRLTRIFTNNIQDLRYAYDFVGNVLGINNSIDSTNYLMEYDNLDRLVFTERRNNSQNPTSNIVFTQNFSYNSIGNMLSMLYDSNNYSFSYNSTPVHAPVSLTITDNIPTKLFTMQDTSGNSVASFTSTGDITLKGTCSKQTSCTAQPNSFNIYNSNGDTVAYIDTNGNLCVETGDCLDNSASCSPPAGSFYFSNSNGNTVIYIDQTGDLCLTGSLTQNDNP